MILPTISRDRNGDIWVDFVQTKGEPKYMEMDGERLLIGHTQGGIRLFGIWWRTH